MGIMSNVYIYIHINSIYSILLMLWMSPMGSVTPQVSIEIECNS